jgi:hypothetical protein
MSHIEPKLELAGVVTDPREIEKLKELTTACEREHFQPLEVLQKYLQVSGFISRMNKNFDTDERWLSGLEQTVSVQVILGSIRSTRESMWRAVTAVECRLIHAGVLHMPGLA